jgi:hypothetical protein
MKQATIDIVTTWQKANSIKSIMFRSGIIKQGLEKPEVLLENPAGRFLSINLCLFAWFLQDFQTLTLTWLKMLTLKICKKLVFKKICRFYLLKNLRFYGKTCLSKNLCEPWKKTHDANAELMSLGDTRLSCVIMRRELCCVYTSYEYFPD